MTTLLIDDNERATEVGSYVNITGTGTTLVKTGAGYLYSVTFNKPVATGTVELDDAVTNTTPKIGTITVPASPQPVTVIYNLAFTTGLSVTVGTAAQDITITYR